MKKLLITLLFPVFCFGQKDTSTYFNLVKSYSLIISIQDSVAYNQILFRMGDSIIEIHGDTTKVLWLMQKYITEYSDRMNAAQGVLARINLKVLKELIKNKDFNRVVDYYLKTEKKYKIK